MINFKVVVFIYSLSGQLLVANKLYALVKGSYKVKTKDVHRERGGQIFVGSFISLQKYNDPCKVITFRLIIGSPDGVVTEGYMQNTFN